MTSIKDTDDLQRVTLNDNSTDFDASPDNRVSGEFMLEPEYLTHCLTQHMTATWGN